MSKEMDSVVVEDTREQPKPIDRQKVLNDIAINFGIFLKNKQYPLLSPTFCTSKPRHRSVTKNCIFLVTVPSLTKTPF